MARLQFLVLIVSNVFASLSFAAPLAAADVCSTIQSKVSTSSAMLTQGQDNFNAAIKHWFNSSSQTPACVLEPATPEDVSTAMKIISANKTPFAIYCHGHASNAGFSSTTGVHINLAKMNQVILSEDGLTAEIGYGNGWADVYKALNGTGRNVNGGRVSGPGVGGFSLGGGYTWKTNQYGLTSDTIKSYNLVLANGTITTVDESTPDLFFALKGGLNRFGVVTSAVYYTHAQVPLVWGGIRVYLPNKIDDVLAATADFIASNTDPKAQVIHTIQSSSYGTLSLVLFFYDGQEPPASIFANYNAIDSLADLVRTQTYVSFINAMPSSYQSNPRGGFNSLATTNLTLPFLMALKNESDTLGKTKGDRNGITVSWDIEPFLPTYGQHAIANSAFPHSDSQLPLNLYWSWKDAADDAYWYNEMWASTNRTIAVAQQEGIMYTPTQGYPNYALYDSSLELLYGVENAARLRTIQAAVDPDQILLSLSGGFTY